MFESFRQKVFGSDGNIEIKKKKKKKFEQREINEDRIVLFDFPASPEYPEQISVKAEEIVFQIETFEDGWCKVRNAEGMEGVIPTAYTAKIIKTQANETRSFIPQQLQQKIKGLGTMAAIKFQQKITNTIELVFSTIKFVVKDVIIPSGVKFFLIISRNESYTTTVSTIGRKIYEISMSTLIPFLNDDELASLSNQLRNDSARIKTERSRRVSSISEVKVE